MSENNKPFGPGRDEHPDYWQNQLAARDGKLLDNHFANRSHGQKNGQDSSINAYAIPKSSKVGLKVNPQGGLPDFDGAAPVWDAKYSDSRSKFLQNGQAINLPDPFQGQQPTRVNEEVNVGNILAQRMMNHTSQNNGPLPGTAMLNQQQGLSQAAPQVSTCTLVEGQTFYQSLQIQGFGTTTPLAKMGGTIKGVQGRQFQVEGVLQCYVVDGLQTIDLSKMEPSRQRTLVRVTAPLLGTFLVPQEAIVQESGNGTGRQLLTDSTLNRNISGRPEGNINPAQAAWLHHQQQAQQQANRLTSLPQHPQAALPSQNRPVNPQEMIQAQTREMLKRRGILKG